MPGSPGNEHNLSLATQRLRKAIAQLAQRILSPHESALGRYCWNGGHRPGALAHGSDKPIPTPVQSLDKQRLLRRVLQRTSDFEDALLYGLRLDMSAWPHCIEQFIMRHEASGVLHQMAQDRKRLGRQQDALIISLITCRHRHWLTVSSRNGGNSFMIQSSRHTVSTFELLLTLCTPKWNPF